MINDKNYLGLTLIGEARGEPIEGIVGVANVIKNRAYTEKKLYKDVVLAPKQFSCWNQGDLNYEFIQKISSDLDQGNEIKDIYLRQCLAVSNAVYEGDFADNVKGSKNYVTLKRYQLAQARQDKQFDMWIVRMKVVCTLGRHNFLI